MADKTKFLKDHRNEFIQKIRVLRALADFLLEKRCISQEMYSKIIAQETNQDKTREIFSLLNCTDHYNTMFFWLKENETALVEELENRSRRETQQTVDEADNPYTVFPDLKITSTFAKLEKWLSEPDTSQRLIEYLEKKLGTEGLENLKKDLKGKELKTSLCFNAKNVDDIKKNRELEKFLDTTNGAKFPKLTFSMFFKKRCSVSSRQKAESSTDDEENMNTTADYLNRSGYGSYDPHSTQNGEETPDDVYAESGVTSGFNENGDEKNLKKTHSDGQPQPPGQTPKESPKQEEEEEEETLLKDTRGSVDMPEIKEANLFEPVPSKLLQKLSPENCPASTSDQMPSEGVSDRQEKTEAEILAPSKETVSEARTSTSGAEPLCSNPEPAPGTNKRKRKKGNQLEKKKHIKTSLICDWAMKQCNDGERKNIINQISVINKAEHGIYPFFTAENIHLFKNPTSHQSQILLITAEKTSRTTKSTLQYLMFVCEVKEAVLLCPEKPDGQQIEYEESFIWIRKCLRFISEAFAPALAVFKKIQKEELDSNPGRIKDLSQEHTVYL